MCSVGIQFLGDSLVSNDEKPSLLDHLKGNSWPFSQRLHPKYFYVIIVVRESNPTTTTTTKKLKLVNLVTLQLS